MRTAAALLLFCLLAATPASSEIVVSGDTDFGVRTDVAPECEDQEKLTVGCYAATPESAPKAGGPRISIGGEARMGLVYDGNTVRPKSKVSITISFDAVTDGGMHIHGSTKLPSVQ